MRVSFLFVAALLGGCAAGTSQAVAPRDFRGTWVGRLDVTSYKLQQGGVVGGWVRLVLEQRGSWLTGELECLGLHGRVNARVDGTTFSGDFSGVSMNVGGGVPFEGTLVGDHLEGRLDGSPLTVRRVPECCRPGRWPV